MLQVYRELRAAGSSTAKMNRATDDGGGGGGGGGVNQGGKKISGTGDNSDSPQVSEIQKLIVDVTRSAREKVEKDDAAATASGSGGGGPGGDTETSMVRMVNDVTLSSSTTEEVIKTAKEPSATNGSKNPDALDLLENSGIIEQVGSISICDKARGAGSSKKKIFCIHNQGCREPYLDNDCDVLLADTTNSSTIQRLKIRPCPVHLEGSFFEMSFRLTFNENGGFVVVPDDTLQFAAAVMGDEYSDVIEAEIIRARHRLVCEPEPPRFLEAARKLESKIDPLDIEAMAAQTRLRGLTRFEVAIIAKDITYCGRNLEIQDEHKTPGLIQSENDYGDPRLEDELKCVKNPDKAPQIEESHMKSLGLDRVVAKLEFIEDEQRLMAPKCPICKEEGPLKCKNCLKVGYCSKEHQKEHWKVHKKNCVLYSIETNDILGRHMVARCEIQPGRMILRESALVTGPTMGDFIAGNLKFDIKGLVKEEDEQTITQEMGQFTVEEVRHLAGNFYAPKCLGCYMDLKQFPVYSVKQPEPMCPKCKWPLCSLQCGQIENHEMECEYFRENSIVYEEVNSEYLLVPRVFIVLRCLLFQEKKPEVWNTIINLQSNSHLREDWEKVNGTRFHDLYLVRMLKSGFKCRADPKLIRTIIDIVDCNAYYGSRRMAEDSRYCESMKRLGGLFDKASFLSHSCIPNAIAIMSPYDHTIEVIAGHKIFKGEPILIDYDYSGNVRSKTEHRDFLLYNYFFNCTCELCSDPTENGLCLNGVICTKCKLRGRQGIVVPMDPYNKECAWKCCACGHERAFAAISRVYADVQKTLASPDGSFPRVIERVSDCILHKLNTVVLQAELGAVHVSMTEDYQWLCTLDDHYLAFIKNTLETRLNLLKLFYPDIDKRIVNLRLAMCGVCVYEAMNPRYQELSRVKACLDTCYDRLTELTSLFTTGLGDESFNQYHAYLFRTIRIGLARLLQIKVKWSHVYSQYHQLTAERVKDAMRLLTTEESKFKENLNTLKKHKGQK